MKSNVRTRLKTGDEVVVIAGRDVRIHLIGRNNHSV